MFRDVAGRFKAQAAIAIVFLLAGLILGFLINPSAAKPPATYTVTEKVVQTVTVAQTTVQVRNRPAPYSVYAQHACLVQGPPPGEGANTTIPQGCPEPNRKAISVTVKFTELGTEKSYISPNNGVVVMTPGLAPTSLVEGYPIDAFGKIVINPGRFDTSVTVLIEVTDLYSYVNWMRDVGKITLIFKIVDENNQHIMDVHVEGIAPYGGAWSLEEAAQEVARGG